MATKANQTPKKTSNARLKQAALETQKQNRRELYGVFLIIFALYFILCWVNTNALLIRPTAKLIGGLFGQIGRYLLPPALIWCGVILLTSRGRSVRLRVFCVLSLVLVISAIVHIICEFFGDFELGLQISLLYKGGQSWRSGGLIPGLVAELLQLCFMKIGAILLLLLAFVLLLLGSRNITVTGIIAAVRKRPVEEPEPEEDPSERFVNRVVEKRRERQERQERKLAPSDIDLPVDDPPLAKKPSKREKKKEVLPSPDEFVKKEETPIINAEEKQVTIDEIELHEPVEPKRTVTVLPTVPVTAPVQEEAEVTPSPVSSHPSGLPPLQQPSDKLKKGEAAACAEEISQEIAKNAEPAPAYVFPSLSLLQRGRTNHIDATNEMRENTKRLSDALKSFGVEPHIVDVIRGPSVTRYELELDPGVKLSKITNLSDDIALALGAQGVRISAIPDKISVVGIEVPNKAVTTVFAHEVLSSDAFQNSKSKVSFAVGKDIGGSCIVGDIAKLPHMLIAGTTGSGKSVCTNTLIISLLYKSKPEDVRLIMVDPKMVELGVYNGIPHLLIPVVTDPKKAAGALQWTVTEMMRRYRLMSEEGVRDLESYNKSIANDPDQEKMPQIVVVIDELADLMLVAAKEVEESICRIAQMGRASGIHLVIATQRPSSDVITGLMKANIPSRIAFAVSSALESRIILDTQGAEKLVGKGDMLFAPLGQGKPKRVQGCFITDDEVQAVVNSIKSQTTSDYSNEIMEQIEKRAEQGGKATQAAPEPAHNESEAGDELLPAAVEVILETGQASVSMLQRRLKLGYARAARIVDEMEERGIVGPFEGAKPRQLMITREQWEQMKNGTYNPPVEEEIP